MCDVAERLEKMGEAKGRAEGIRRMLNSGKTPEQIAEFCEYPLDEVKAIQKSLLTTV